MFHNKTHTISYCLYIRNIMHYTYHTHYICIYVYKERQNRVGTPPRMEIYEAWPLALTLADFWPSQLNHSTALELSAFCGWRNNHGSSISRDEVQYLWHWRPVGNLLRIQPFASNKWLVSQCTGRWQRNHTINWWHHGYSLSPDKGNIYVYI